MENDLYKKLAKHLDNLPGGFPETDSGVEIRILKRLFTPEDAELALTLTLIEEEPHVIAKRAGISAEEATKRLSEMEKKGLIYGTHSKDNIDRYMALHFIIGIWEFQVDKLNPDLVRDVDEYLPYWADVDTWKNVPQIRSIPVGEAIDSQLEITSYENAEELVDKQDKIAVAPCICRTEQQMIGKGCDKPLETCLSFGSGAEFYVRNGMGRFITKDEAFNILKQANTAGLVLSPGNSQKATFICACCGCCCGVLRTLKTYPKPAEIVSSPFVARHNKDTCIDCSVCVERCQMDALQSNNGKITLDKERCIGCGLCVTTCPTDSLILVRKPEDWQHAVPKNFTLMNIKLGQHRGKLSMGRLMKMLVKSKLDRINSPKKWNL
ncbi:MAG TPA: 4Fe-4S binding protein [Sedimentibacter sp.]|nr:4Fe-4S binding protein [Sedimentibacter sp.]HOG63609.1 4Fe-4S binding protein [Sedimentibacter sp.]